MSRLLCRGSYRITGVSRFTVPLLWDKKIHDREQRELGNNTTFNDFLSSASLDFCPEKLRAEIKELDEWI